MPQTYVSADQTSIITQSVVDTFQYFARLDANRFPMPEQDSDAGDKPTPNDPLSRKEPWYDSLHDNESARDFYQTHLLDDAVTQSQCTLQAAGLGDWQPTDMISIVSNSDELILLAAKVFRPMRCHLIYTNDAIGAMKARFDRVANQLTAIGKTPLPIEVPDSAGSLLAIANAVQQIARLNTGSNDVLIDVTPGRRAMQMAMLQTAKKSDRVLCWWQDTSIKTRRAMPCTNLQPLIWEVTTDNGLSPHCPRVPG